MVKDHVELTEELAMTAFLLSSTARYIKLYSFKQLKAVRPSVPRYCVYCTGARGTVWACSDGLLATPASSNLYGQSQVFKEELPCREAPKRYAKHVRSMEKFPPRLNLPIRTN
jgi:hypothetical protein